MARSNGWVASQVDGLGVNGVALAKAAQGGIAVGVRWIPLLPKVGRLDAHPLFAVIQEIGPIAAEGRYFRIRFQVPVSERAAREFMVNENFEANSSLRFKWGREDAATVTLEWAFADGAVVGRIEADREVPMVALGNGCLAAAEDAKATASGACLSQKGEQVSVAYSEKAEMFQATSSLNRFEWLARGWKIKKPSARRVSGHLFTVGKPMYFTMAPGGRAVRC
ncbi:MAG: hypothetical protein FWF84_06485, partial [Kiritimatiellaeota bacterium]|nr:hypothetical protein [Kiritimatiellota bacterium]